MMAARCELNQVVICCLSEIFHNDFTMVEFSFRNRSHIVSDSRMTDYNPVLCLLWTSVVVVVMVVRVVGVVVVESREGVELGSELRFSPTAETGRFERLNKNASFETSGMLKLFADVSVMCILAKSEYFDWQME